MIRDEVIIGEINALWLPVYPFMTDYLLAVSVVVGGRFLDLGPFAGGLALNILRKRETRVLLPDANPAAGGEVRIEAGRVRVGRGRLRADDAGGGHRPDSL